MFPFDRVTYEHDKPICGRIRRNWGEGKGDIAFSVTSSIVLFCVILCKGDFVCTRFVSHDPRRRVEGARFIPLVPCAHVYRWTRVWFDRKGLSIFFGGLAPLFGLALPPWGFVRVMKVSIRNFMAVKGSRLERNIEDRSVNFSEWKNWKYRFALKHDIPWLILSRIFTMQNSNPIDN